MAQLKNIIIIIIIKILQTKIRPRTVIIKTIAVVIQIMTTLKTVIVVMATVAIVIAVIAIRVMRPINI